MLTTLVFPRTVATCHCYLGSYVAISFALEYLAIPDQTLVDDLVGILWRNELDDDAAHCGLGRSVSDQENGFRS